jgi:hypothetical protein
MYWDDDPSFSGFRKQMLPSSDHKMSAEKVRRVSAAMALCSVGAGTWWNPGNLQISGQMLGEH